MVTLTQLQKIMPFAGRRALLYYRPLTDAMEEFGINTPAREAAFLALIAI
jgi:putative chitinase